MLNYFFKQEEMITVDLHALRSWEAVLLLNDTIQKADNSIREIVVIHGYHRGDLLLNLVRQDYRNNRIANKFIGLNQGRTSFILKNKEDK